MNHFLQHPAKFRHINARMSFKEHKIEIRQEDGGSIMTFLFRHDNRLIQSLYG